MERLYQLRDMVLYAAMLAPSYQMLRCAYLYFLVLSQLSLSSFFFFAGI